MLDSWNFRLREIIGLMHSLEKKYYQNKTQLRYNFGSVYIKICSLGTGLFKSILFSSQFTPAGRGFYI